MEQTCPKCHNLIPDGMKFCVHCGQPVAAPRQPQAPVQPTQPQAQRPMRPQPLNAAPVQPQAPRPMTAPGQPQRPLQPQAPQQGKGIMSTIGRAVGNAVSFGALGREIDRNQQQAVNQQRRDDQQVIKDERQAREEAERAQIAAERETERARDRRAMEAVEGIDVVRGRAIWNIQPGEIARRLSERELEEVEKLKGIIVQEGCTAIIFANGELVSTLSAGAYMFYKSLEEEQKALKDAIEKAEQELSEMEKRERDCKRQAAPTFRELGIVGEIGRGFRWLGRIIFGEKKNEQKDKRKKRQIDYARLLARITQAPILSVYIVSNRNLTLTFGGTATADGGMEFAPYKIPMGVLDVEIGVSLQMQVTDIHAFATNYLADRSSATVAQIQQLINGSVEACVKQVLRNLDYQQSGLDAATIDLLKAQIQQTINQHVFGIACTQVLQITDSNADFERFRSVERELFNTERELDFMHRTGEFRNRMESEANSQQIQSAQNAEQLRHALQQVNKDQLLHDDELEEFVLLLESQKRIREAKTEEEEFEALEDLRKSRLVKQEELEVLEDELAHKKIPREEITQIMRIQSEQKVDEARLKAEWALGDQRQDHDWEREDLERRRNWGIEDEEREREWMQEEREYNRDLQREHAEDDYDFQQMMRQRDVDWEDRQRERQWQREDEQTANERERQTKFDDDQLDANRSQRQIDKLQAMAQMQAQLDAQQQQHEENLATIKANEQTNRDNLFANMTAEQIRAAQLSHLTGEAQVAMANAYNGEREAEILRQQAAKDEARAQADREAAAKDKSDLMQFAMQMAGMVKDTAASVSGAQQASQQQQLDQLRQANQRAQERLDHTQDMAMNNIAQVSTAAANNINAFNGGLTGNQPQTPPQPTAAPQSQQAAPELMECQCYNCQHVIHIPVGAPQCPDCGAPFQW